MEFFKRTPMNRLILSPISLILFLSLSACHGMVASAPQQISYSDQTATAQTPGSNPNPASIAAAAPLDVMSAPADDDGIQTSSQTNVHFGLFFGPNLNQYFVQEYSEGFGWGLIAKNTLKFLINVGISPPGCNSASPVECYQWLDPNLLKNWTVRIYVTSRPKTSTAPSPETLRVLDDLIYYCQEFHLTEKNTEGSNLSLNEMALSEGDRITIILYNYNPNAMDFAPSTPCKGPSAPQDTPFELWDGKGAHTLANFKIIEEEITVRGF